MIDVCCDKANGCPVCMPENFKRLDYSLAAVRDLEIQRLKERIAELEVDVQSLGSALHQSEQEVERLQSIVDALAMPTNDEWMKEWLDD